MADTAYTNDTTVKKLERVEDAPEFVKQINTKLRGIGFVANVGVSGERILQYCLTHNPPA